MKYIYLLTSPNGKKYIGKSTLPINKKKQIYENIAERDKSTTRLVVNAIRKYGWEKFSFEVIEESKEWNNEKLNERERFYIKHLDTYYTNGKGYNMTIGVDGVDSKYASIRTKKHHESMTDEQKTKRSKNCSIGQRKRFRENPESDKTKQRKKKAHQGHYLIESPSGDKWEITNGLKEFAEEFGDQIGTTYWSLFAAYRKNYNNKKTTRKRKDSNTWKVIRLDK